MRIARRKVESNAARPAGNLARRLARHLTKRGPTPAPALTGLTAITAITAITLGLGGCGILPDWLKPSEPPSSDNASQTTTQPGESISAQTPAIKAYRKTGARSIYAKYKDRIFKGKLPPLVYAVAVVETQVDAQGNVKWVAFSRKPEQAPEVPVEIAAMIRMASPLPPPPAGIGEHTYVDTWLWDKSGKFQLDSLTEGQRSR